MFAPEGQEVGQGDWSVCLRGYRRTKEEKRVEETEGKVVVGECDILQTATTKE